MRVGLYGGSFNPAHGAHAHVAQTALRRLRLQRVIWLVAPQNPLKDARESAPLAERVAGVRRLARGPSMIVSDIESRIGARYTVDTLSALRRRFRGVRFVWVMGSDSLGKFHRWRGWPQIFRAMPIAVVDRPGAQARARFAKAAQRFGPARRRPGAAPRLALGPAPAWVDLRARLNPLSSTALRQKRSAG